MKSLSSSFLVLLFFISSNFINAQEIINISNKTVAMSQGEQLAYTLEIPQADYNHVVKNWSKLIRQNTKEKVQEIGPELNIKNTLIEDIYKDPINIYSTLIHADSSVKLLAIFEIDSIFYVFKENSDIENEKIHHHIQHFLKDFANSEYRYVVEEELEAEEKVLKGLNKELGSLTKENENMHKEIKENEQNIINSEDAIKSLETDNQRKQEEIDAKKESIASLSGQPELEEQAKDQLKVLKKEKKSISNKIEKEQKNIVKYQANIEEYNRNIERNLEQQELKKQEIDKQEAITDAVQSKLRGIK